MGTPGEYEFVEDDPGDITAIGFMSGSSPEDLMTGAESAGLLSDDDCFSLVGSSEARWACMGLFVSPFDFWAKLGVSLVAFRTQVVSPRVDTEKVRAKFTRLTLASTRSATTAFWETRRRMTAKMIFACRPAPLVSHAAALTRQRPH